MTGHFNYILICSDGTLYSGYTVDPKKRLAAHNVDAARNIHERVFP